VKPSLPIAFATSTMLFVASYFANFYLAGGSGWIVICTIMASTLVTAYSKNFLLSFVLLLTSILISAAFMYVFAVSVDFHDYRWLWHIWCVLGEDIVNASSKLVFVFSLVSMIVGMATTIVVSWLKD
jgi:hypothetical protein